MVDLYDWEINFKVAADMIEYVKSKEGEVDKEVLEGYGRSIVHKSYYGCFHLVLEKNTYFGLVTDRGGKNSHATAIEQIDDYPIEMNRDDRR